MIEYGLQEPEFIDMEIALRINLYRNVWDDELKMEASQNDVEALRSAGAAEENCGIYKRKRADSFCGGRRIAGMTSLQHCDKVNCGKLK